MVTLTEKYKECIGKSMFNKYDTCYNLDKCKSVMGWENSDIKDPKEWLFDRLKKITGTECEAKKMFRALLAGLEADDKEKYDETTLCPSLEINSKNISWYYFMFPIQIGINHMANYLDTLSIRYCTFEHDGELIPGQQLLTNLVKNVYYPKLQIFSLQGTKFFHGMTTPEYNSYEMIFTCACNFPNLTHLDLNESDINSTAVYDISTLPNLSRIDLGSTKIGDEGVKNIANVLHKMKNLKELIITNNNITDEAFLELITKAIISSVNQDTGLPSTETKLIEIDLNNNKITGEAVKKIDLFRLCWGTLKKIRLQNNKINDDDIIQLQNKPRSYILDLEYSDESSNTDYESDCPGVIL